MARLLRDTAAFRSKGYRGLKKLVRFGPIPSAARRRRYLSKAVALSRLVRFIGSFQAEHHVAPSLYAMAAAVRTSRSQAKRLLSEALQRGMIHKARPDALIYDIVLIPPHLPGIVRIPLVECRWRFPIKWVDSPTRGVWLDRGVYQIADTRGLWALTFPELPKDGSTPNLRLDANAMALVRRCEVSEAEEGHWYVVEFNGRVIVKSFYEWAGKDLIFRSGPGDSAPDRISPKLITALGQVRMVTTRPPEPRPESDLG